MGLKKRDIGIMNASLKNVGVRITKQRVALLSVLTEAIDHPDALELLGLADRIHHQPNQLSGGQQQRVAIARSLVVNPQVILADEPTGALDTDTGNEIMGILSDLVKERRITLVLVTHESHIANWSNRSILMRDGLILEDYITVPQVNRVKE